MNAGDVFNDAAAFLNDNLKEQFTNEVQMPYLNIALENLQRKMELNNVPYTNLVSSTIAVAASTVAVSITSTSMPTGLIEIRKLLERPAGTTDPFIEMTRVEFLPEIAQSACLIYWAWQQQQIKLLGATAANEIKLEYIQSVFTPVTTANTVINVINARGYLGYQTAGLCAEFNAENLTRAESLYAKANDALDDFLGINTKGRQAIAVRRRPFMASYKSRGI